jgi:hypothetical protein
MENLSALSHDSDLIVRIEKLGAAVQRSGQAFEDKVRALKASDPDFLFLVAEGPANAYYRHVLNCLVNGGWTAEQLARVRNDTIEVYKLALLCA